MPPSGQDTTIVIMKSQKLSTTTLGLHKNGPIRRQAVVMESPRGPDSSLLGY